MDIDTYIQTITPLLKKYGFRKSGLTWRKKQTESISVFNIQKSQWDKSKFYINIGSYFLALGCEDFPTENKCHIRTRISMTEPEAVISSALEWLDVRASLSNAARLVEQDKVKGFVDQRVGQTKIT